MRSDSGHELAELVLRTSQSPIMIWDPDGRPAAFNQAYCDVFGYSVEEAGALRIADLIHPDDLELSLEELAARPADDPSGIKFHYRFLVKNGRVLHVDGQAVGMLLGDRMALLVEYRDVTEQTVTRAALEELEERYRRIVDRAPLAIFTTDSDNRFSSANPICLKLLGCSLEQLKALTPFDLVPSAYREQAAALAEARNWSDSRNPRTFEIPIKHGDGSSSWCEITLLPRFDEESTFLGLDASPGISRSSAS